MARTAVLAGTLVIILLLTGLTIAGGIEGDINVLGVLVTLLVLALLGFGVLGALSHRPPDE
jgi:ABC-type polysaccharide/polyol phosphate export permease